MQASASIAAVCFTSRLFIVIGWPLVTIVKKRYRGTIHRRWIFGHAWRYQAAPGALVQSEDTQ